MTAAFLVLIVAVYSVLGLLASYSTLAMSMLGGGGPNWVKVILAGVFWPIAVGYVVARNVMADR